nr:ATPase family AAA domain-containing protein 5 [Megalopta genalis]
MKNITQYLVDTVKPSGITTNDTRLEEESNNGSKRKRNRVKIKISRTSTKETVCDIIESSSDMIDKTPSPFTREAAKHKNSLEKSKRSSSKLQTLVNMKKLEDESLDYLSIETNDKSYKERNYKRNSENSVKNNRKTKKTLKDKEGTKSDTSVCNTVKNKEPEVINLINISDSEDDNHEESNAFQILMNRKKQVHSLSPTKPAQTDEADIKKSGEYKIKLKQTKEKLIALADKKGYSKQKLAEIEEGEKIERIIQKRIKLFKKDTTKDSNGEATIFTQSQSCGSLLNYFSKVPVNLTHSNVANMSTIVVKADVHMAENSTQHNIYNSSSKKGPQLNKQNKLDMKFSQIDDISIIDSENINMTCKTKKHDSCGQSKHRWSLRIKLQNYENENLVADEISDEEIFSAQRRSKINTKSSKKSEATKNISVVDKNPKRALKQVNEESILKHELLKNAENDLAQKDKHKSTFDNSKHTSTVSKSLDSCLNSNLNDYVIISESKLKRKTVDKLAPLFTKRRKPDPEIIAARRLFLQPDVTDNSKSVVRKVTVDGTLPFPVVSHITQLNNVISNETKSFHIPEKLRVKFIPVINSSDYTCTMDFSEIKLEANVINKKAKVSDILTEMEKFCTDTRQMWSVISHIFKGQPIKTVSPRTRTKRSKFMREEKMIEKRSTENQIENYNWTYKYRPRSIKEVVGNEEAGTKLREWLIGWKATFRNENNSSGDEFYSSDSTSSRIHENNQVAILLGPHGSGKTASVYAVAEEFGYTVLEVNASSRRTGKILLKELEEATKSHRIKKKSDAPTFFNLSSDETVPKKISQKSLILIEDIDLIFEEDEGFISATYQLALNTKRPIVMTCRDICPHLAKIAPQQNRIYFQQATGSRIVALLQLIALAETGYSVSTDYITELIQIGDLRKAILKLQYLMLSNPTHVIAQSIIFKNSFWESVRYNLYKPAIKENKKQKTKKAADRKVTNFNKHILDNLANKLNDIVLMSSLIHLEDSALNLSQIKMQPSLSLLENTDSYSASNSICFDIAEWLSKTAVYSSQLSSSDGTSYRNNITLKRQLNKGVNSALSQTTSFLLDRQVISTDYLPCLRTICRAEESRANMNNKRGNRFFHYLHNLKGPSTSLKPNILSAACRVMRDTVDNDANTSTTCV